MAKHARTDIRGYTNNIQKRKEKNTQMGKGEKIRRKRERGVKGGVKGSKGGRGAWALRIRVGPHTKNARSP